MICNCYGMGRCALGLACEDPACVKAWHPGVVSRQSHQPDCLVAQAMRWRCPECRARRRSGDTPEIRHNRFCKLKEYQP